MHAITLTRRIDSDRLPELTAFFGMDVEIHIAEKVSNRGTQERWKALESIAGTGILDLDAIRAAEQIEWDEAERLPRITEENKSEERR